MRVNGARLNVRKDLSNTAKRSNTRGVDQHVSGTNDLVLWHWLALPSRRSQVHALVANAFLVQNERRPIVVILGREPAAKVFRRTRDRAGHPSSRNRPCRRFYSRHVLV